MCFIKVRTKLNVYSSTILSLSTVKIIFICDMFALNCTAMSPEDDAFTDKSGNWAEPAWSGTASCTGCEVAACLTWTRAPPMLKCKYVDEMIWLPCWLPRGQQVSHQSESEESIVSRQQSTQIRESTVTLKPRTYVTRSQNRDISGSTKRTYVLQIFKKKSAI